MKKLSVFFVLIILAIQSRAQDKYWVSFTDKAGTTFDPYQYFDQRTIDQRSSQNISLLDSTDFPLNENYVSAVKSTVSTSSYSSRWLNGLAVYATREEIEKVKTLPFVRGIEVLDYTPHITMKKEKQKQKLSHNEIALLYYQTNRMQGEKFKAGHLDGSGIRIALFDAGFPGVDRHPAFEHLRRNKKIIATYDFVQKKDFVYSHNSHGVMTLSCIAGIMDTINSGLATGAEFLLARTEKAFGEPYSEEENWLAAAEWADRNGANIISSSLGYTNSRYFNTDMNGQKSLIAKAANIAAKKGILVVNAAGNDGDDAWHIIDTPGDADSVLTVGGTNPLTDMHIYFSSYGPTSDGRLKPNVSSLGNVIAANSSGWSEVYGTSFSTPLVAGFAACAWQARRNLTNMELFHEIEKASHLYPYFDYAHGYGIPQAGYFTDKKDSIEPTFDFVIVNNDMKIILREKYSHASAEEFLGYSVRRNLYYRIDDKNGKVRFYSVILAEEKEVLHYKLDQFQPGDKLTVHFEGYTSSYVANTGENQAPQNKQ